MNDMIRNLLLIFFGVFTFMACQSNSSDTAAAEEAVSVIGDDYHGLPIVDIELNSGEKWKVNEEMKPFVENGRQIVAEFIQTGQTNYEELAARISNENSEIIKHCTMKGKSHDELHRWLHPHMELTKELRNATSEAEGKKKVARLKASYDVYSRYFQ